jgi:hypothetical protein
MSLWTPDGERPVARSTTASAPGVGEAPGLPDDIADLSPEDQARFEAMQAEMEAVRTELLGAPASIVIANHAMGIYELAAIHLTASEPQLSEASLAIDALGALVDGLVGRLGDAEPTLREALAQLRAAYLEVSRERP